MNLRKNSMPTIKFSAQNCSFERTEWISATAQIGMEALRTFPWREMLLELEQNANDNIDDNNCQPELRYISDTGDTLAIYITGNAQWEIYTYLPYRGLRAVFYFMTFLYIFRNTENQTVEGVLRPQVEEAVSHFLVGDFDVLRKCMRNWAKANSACG